MTVRSEAVSSYSRSACKRRRVSEVARELHGNIGAEEHEPPVSRIAENDENCMPENSAQAHAGHRLEGVNDAVASAPSKASEIRELDKAIHLDYGALVHVFARCEGISRVQFGCVCKLWRKVRQALAVHIIDGPDDLKSALEDDEVQPYDTVVLPPGMYKHRVLCSKPVKLIAQASWLSKEYDQHLKATGSAITADSVIFWQERAPAILVNTDAVCLQNITVKIETSAHEYSSVAYGPNGRAITMKQCTIMGSTGLRVPYTLDPLMQLLLKLQGCTIQGVKAGLCGVCVLSGQLIMEDSSVHDCTFGIEVQEDGHALLDRTSISFCTDCALVCEGHTMMNQCQVFACTAAWAKGPIVMEEESHSTPRDTLEKGASEQSDDSPNDAENSGLRPATGIRRDAQLRLRDCQVDSGRLTSTIVTADAEQNGNSRTIRRLMREVYGNPDQDYEDWQIVMLSDMEDEGSEDGDAEVDSDDQASDDMAISSDGSEGDADDDNDLSDHDGDVMAVAGVDSDDESEDSSEDGNESGQDFDYGSEENSDDETSSDEG